jgi:hypothetical protein
VTWYRNQGYSQLLTMVAAVFAAGAVIFAISRTDATVAGRWVPAAVVVAISLFCWFRLAKAGVYADDRGIRVLNPFRTVHLAWDDIERFTARAHKGFPALGFAELADGGEVELWGIQARSPSEPSKKVARELVAELNERLAQERARSVA